MQLTSNTCLKNNQKKEVDKMLKNKKGLFIVLSGPSGVGKGTICKELIEYFNGWFSVSVTTRDKRDGEIDGKDYFFVTKEEFEQKIKDNDFLEYATYNNNYYGTLKSKINEKLDNNIDVFAEIEVKGARNIKEIYKDSILIYILPPSLKELEERLRNRHTEDEETIKNRMSITKEELKQIDIYDYAIVNDDLEKAKEMVKHIIESEKTKVSRNIINIED